MASETIPAIDTQYMQWIAQFATVAAANAEALDLTSDETELMTEMASAFADIYAAHKAAQQAAKGKSAQKRDMRKDSERIFRSVAKKITANSDIPIQLKANLGLKVTPKTTGPVRPVTELSSIGYSNGANELEWNRNGNSQTTIFQVQAKVGETGSWTIVGTTNRVRFTHQYSSPGLLVFYRVISQRAGKESLPSPITALYEHESLAIPSLAVAA